MSDDFERFLELLVTEGHVAPATARTWASAVRAVTADSREPFDPATSDVDKVLKDFARRGGKKLAANTLEVYESRVRRAIEAYRAYLEDPEQRPKLRTGQGTGSPQPPAPTTVALAYELEHGGVAEMRLPIGITRKDADRLKKAIDLQVND